MPADLLTISADDSFDLHGAPRRGLTRRAFLAAAAAAGGVAMLPAWVLTASEAFAAGPLGPGEGILVVVTLGGGNDGLNTVVPLDQGRYRDLRGSLAIGADVALPLAPGYGLHPSLVNVKRMWDEGHVAVVQGVGYPDPSLSHFDSMAVWMGGHAQRTSGGTGWLGRYLDGLGGDDALQAVTIGSSTALTLQGRRRSGTALPGSMSGAFGADRASAHDARMFDAVTALGQGPHRGVHGDRLAAAGRTGTQLAGVVAPAYLDLPSGRMVQEMALAAKLVNADVGLRVINLSLGSFDTHSGQASTHQRLLADLDAGLAAFYAALAPDWRARVTLMTFSEFGRRAQANSSSGTDHGTASNLFVIGDAVKPGLFGLYPSLNDLDGDGNLRHSVDFRSVYASVLGSWMGADANEVLAGGFEDLGLFRASPAGGAPLSGRRVPTNGGRGTGAYGYWLTTTAGEVTAFGDVPHLGDAPAGSSIVAMAACPGRDGYWLASPEGTVHAFGSARHHGGLDGSPLTSPIVGMASTPSGEGYWMLGRDGGVFSFGDAEFYGSTGAIALNKPIVAMAALPTGRGYWFVGSDGGVFCFGDAEFFGSTGGIVLNRPVVGMAPTPTGRGYWLVADDGGVFSFGDARFFGSTGDVRLNQPILKMAATPSGRGYWFVASDGGIFSFGDASFHGSLAPYDVVVTALTS